MRLIRDEKAQSLVVIAVFLGVIGIGFIAVALDIGTLFRQKRLAQAAADAAAVAAAKEVSVGNSTANEQKIADTVAKLNGFDTTLSSHAATVALSTPTTGNFKGTGYVQATVTRSIPTLFLAEFSSRFSAMPVSATAIAGGLSTSVCVCIESPSAEDIFLVNGAKLNAPNCGVVDDSTASNAVYIANGATLSASSLGTVSSTWNNASNINNGGSISSTTTVVQGISSACAPTMPVAPSYSSCQSDPGLAGGASSAFTAGPASASGTVCYNGLTIGLNGTVPTLNPGIYVINGNNLHFESGNATRSNYGGNGVFFYLINGASLQIDNGANVNLVAGGATESGGATAPSLGVYDGILMYQATGNTGQMTVAGGSNLYINGAMFAPSGQMIFSNATGSTITGGIVCTQLIMTGATVNATDTASQGNVTLISPKLVQ
jgi:hypothetical protein